MSKQIDKEIQEKSWASILLCYLNNKGFDYEIADLDIPSNWADVDVGAKSYSDMSSSFMSSSLYIQLCWNMDPKNPGFEKIAENPKASTFNNFGETFKAIDGKVEKYERQNRNYSQITLAIQTYAWNKENEEYFIPRLREECKKYKFKAIYLLSPKGEIWGQCGIEEEIPELVFQIR